LITKRLVNMALITAVALTFICSFMPYSEAHILVIGDSNGDLPTSYTEAKQVADLLKSKGYDVLEFYNKTATSKNILKGMYGADAVIYAGHGGYETGNYNLNGGTATPPFALVGKDKWIWSAGDKMREDGNSSLFTAPFKQNIPVILLQACFSTGWVEKKEVSNPISTIYNFAHMFTGSGANYYATAWNNAGLDMVKQFLSSKANFGEINTKNTYEKITKMNIYNRTNVWKNLHGYAAFVGNWLGKFPTVSQTTPYDNAAAESWYNSDRSKNPFQSDLVVSQVIAPIRGFGGHTIGVVNTIKNLANVASSGFYVNYYLKKTLSSHSIFIGDRFIPSLDALASKYMNSTVTIPNTIVPGSYYILAYADGGKTNPETNENNNERLSSNKIIVNNIFRDLVVTGITGNMRGYKSNTFYVGSTIKNIGNTGTNSFWIHYYLKKKGETGIGNYVGQRYYSGLGAGSSKYQSVKISVSTRFVGSNYYIGAYADAHKTVPEAVETNNYKVGAIKSV
jgi:hypothetical protein